MSLATRPSGAPGSRYPVRVVRVAERLHRHGKSTAEIRFALAQLGYTPSPSTIIYWCDRQRREAQRLNKRINGANGRSARRRRELAWWAKHRRMRELRDAGLSFNAIAKVMYLDFGLELSGEQVRYGLCRNGDAARWAKRVLGGPT